MRKTSKGTVAQAQVGDVSTAFGPSSWVTTMAAACQARTISAKSERLLAALRLSGVAGSAEEAKTVAEGLALLSDDQWAAGKSKVLTRAGELAAQAKSAYWSAVEVLTGELVAVGVPAEFAHHLAWSMVQETVSADAWL